jgi:ubiquinone/menaquinone biosynthesis C-methylase UbiE
MPEVVYVHGTDPSEQARLARLNALTNAAFIDFLSITPGARVLEVGSGLGILAAQIARSVPGARVVGVERSSEQLAAAVRCEGLAYVQADAHGLELEDASFDLAYCRYVLEHVGDPVRVLAEMRRVVRPGGRVAAQENDISLSRLDPPCPCFEKIWQAFARLQQQLGGDPFVGRRLFRLFRAAGFKDIELSVQPDIHWQGSPGFAVWIENLAGNVRSGRHGLVAAGLATPQEIDDALGELGVLAGLDDASAQFVWNRAVAVR